MDRAFTPGVEQHVKDLDKVSCSDNDIYLENWEILVGAVIAFGAGIVYATNRVLIQPIRHLAFWLNGDNYTFVNKEDIFPHWVKTDEEPRYKTPNLI